ncbi:transaldolase [Helicobacter cinaedi]|uniref:transaldolase n=1 Tax=Helicobacter cinaedi TaxID=213 RepID=UPI000CF02015|nr:transaldolase [Helicobacter cinaedi]
MATGAKKSISKDIDFSLWCDFIQRDFLDKEFQSLVDSGVICGATSNPSIFAKAFQSEVYADSITALKNHTTDSKSVYEELAIADIKNAARILLPLWEKNKANGLVSIEIDPFLCDESGKSVDEGLRLFKRIDMPNVMIKVPATAAGYEVMNALTQKGIDVNATLIFTPSQAKLCASALQSGINAIASKRGGFSGVNESKAPQGVISVFVSRFDRLVDSALPTNLRLQTGIINAMDCYECIESYANPHIRTLFASTGVKANANGDSHLSQSYYIEKLILPHSVNTAPLESIRAYMGCEGADREHTQTPLVDSASRLSFWQRVKERGIVYDDIANQLLDEGLTSFKQSFEELLKGL